MRQYVLCIGMCIVAFFAGSPSAAQSAETVPRHALTVAVLPFQHSGQEYEDIAGELPTLLTTLLSGEPGLALVERAQVDTALEEVALGMSGMVDPNTAAKVGYLTGAQVLVTGRVFPVRKEVVLVARMIGVETGRVYGEMTAMPLTGSVVEASQELAMKVGQTLNARGRTMVAAAPPREDLVAELTPVVAGKALPGVAISIPEVSLTRQVPDPAAEAELAFILQQLGFTIIDPLSGNTLPDVTISGEAFSEFGLRKGNLVSAKGRIELKAVARKGGAVLMVDRATAVAVDLAPEMAGKAAITKATRQLIKRLVQALAASAPPAVSEASGTTGETAKTEE